MSNIEVALFGTLGRDAEHKTSKKWQTVFASQHRLR